MASVFKRKLSSGEFWVLKVRFLDGTWRQHNSKIPVHRANSRKAALAAANKIQGVIDAGGDPFGIKGPPRRSTDVLWDEYISDRVYQWSDKTLECHAITRRLFKGALGEISLYDLNREEIALFRQSLIDRKVKPNTVNHHLRNLRAMLNWCVNERGLANWRVPKIAMMKVPRQTLRDHFNPEELDSLLAVARSMKFKGVRLDIVIIFFVLTGLRKSEALRLKWPDLNWKDSEDGASGGRLRVRGMTKTRRERVVPYGDDLRDLLEHVDTDRGGCIFPFSAKSRRLNDALRSACRKADVPLLKLHNLRDTCAFNMVYAGIPEMIAAEFLGNSPETMRRYYLIVDEAEVDRSVQRVALSEISRVMRKNLRVD